jgi:hypothetical protein
MSDTAKEIREWCLVVRGDSEKPETWHWEVFGPDATAFHDDVTVREVLEGEEDRPAVADTSAVGFPSEEFRAWHEQRFNERPPMNKAECALWGWDAREVEFNRMNLEYDEEVSALKRKLENHKANWETTSVVALRSEIKRMKEENERCKEIAERDGKDYSDLCAANKRLLEALENMPCDCTESNPISGLMTDEVCARCEALKAEVPRG